MNKEEQAEYYRSFVLPKYQTKPLTVGDCERKLELLRETKNELLRELRRINTEIAATERCLNAAQQDY